MVTNLYEEPYLICKYFNYSFNVEYCRYNISNNYKEFIYNGTKDIAVYPDEIKRYE